LIQSTKCFDSKHFVFWLAKHICVFNLWGLFVEYTFGRILIFLNIGNFKKIWNRAKTVFSACSAFPPPPLFPPIHCLPDDEDLWDMLGVRLLNKQHIYLTEFHFSF
jgi:hypothetical protein